MEKTVKIQVKGKKYNCIIADDLVPFEFYEKELVQFIEDPNSKQLMLPGPDQDDQSTLIFFGKNDSLKTTQITVYVQKIEAFVEIPTDEIEPELFKIIKKNLK